MGQALYEQEPVARAVLDRCEAVFQEVRGTSLLDVMFGRNEAVGPLNDTAWEQPALFALECALTALWSSVGVQPAVVMGHSVGELAAAHAAGVFSLEDGMRFAATRGTLLSGTEEGAMAAVFAPAERVATELEGLNGAAGDDEAAGGTGCNISADNGSHQVVSGPVPGIEAVMRHFESAGIRARRLNTTRAFHSALVEPALDALEASLDGVTVNAPSIAVVSNLTGQAVAPEHAFDGAYWKRHAREPVAFAQSVGTLAALGVDLVVEIGPHAILAPMTVSSWPESPQTPAPVIVPSLTRPSDDTPVDGKRAVSLTLWQRYTRPGCRSVSMACTPGSPGAGSRCRGTRSNASVTGSKRRSNDGAAPAIPCWETVTSPPAVRSRSKRRSSPRIHPG